MLNLGFRGASFGAAFCVALLGGCGNNGDDPGRVDSTTSDGTATAQPTTFTATATDSGVGSTGGTDTDSTGGSSGGSTGAGSDGVSCPETHTCIPEPPTDWNGPASRAVSATTSQVQPECPDAYPDVAADVFDGITAPPAECGCGCGPATDASCETSATLRFWDDSDTCGEGVATTVQIFAFICNNLSTTYAADSYWTVDPIETDGGACEPSMDVSVQDAGFETRVLTCGGAELLDGCAEGNICAPLPTAAQSPGLCIWRDGDHECPSTFSERQLLHRDIDDQRGCEACTCGEANGLCDDAFARLYFNGCVNLAASFDTDGECLQQGGVPGTHATLTTGLPTAFCAPSEGSPTGEALGRDPVTVCCNE